MRLLDILDLWRVGSGGAPPLGLPGRSGRSRPPQRAVAFAFLVDLPTSNGGFKLRDLLARPIIPLLRKDGTFGEISLGRSSSAHVQIPHRSMSLIHARFRLFPDGTWQIVDQESTNGTFVNGIRLAPGIPTPLPEGSIIRLGFKRFAFGALGFQQGLQRLVDGKNATGFEETLALPEETVVMPGW